MDTPMPEAVKKLVVLNVNDVEHVASTVDFVFSAVDMSKDEIKAIEEAYAKTETPVVSNNSAHRWTPDVPMVVPEINADHFEVIKDQKKRLGTTRGFIAVKPNCSIQSYAPCLAAWKEFGPKELVVTTYQAISGAGKTFKDWPEMVGNIIPFIGGEEEKSEQEPLRVLGRVENGQIVKADSPKITGKRRNQTCRRTKDHMPVLKSSCTQRTYSSCIHQLREEAYKRAADREACSIQGIPTGSRTSECSEAVYPVP